jgi:hypothetical protein
MKSYLGSMFFIFLFSTPKDLQIGACGYSFSENLRRFFTLDFSYLLGASSDCLTRLKVELALDPNIMGLVQNEVYNKDFNFGPINLD